MKTVTALVTFIFIFSISLTAQDNRPQYGLTANIGLGKLRSPILRENFDTEFSSNFGLRGQWSIGKKSYLGAEFLWLQFAANSTGQFTEENQLTFFSAPFYYKYQADKIGLKIGIQVAVFAFGNKKIANTRDRVPITQFNNPINYGPKFGIDFKVTDRINLRGDVFYDLSDKFSNMRIVGLQQFTVGVDYNFRINREELRSAP